MLQDYHSFQPRPDGGVMCGVLHSAVPAHRGESQTHRGYGRYLVLPVYYVPIHWLFTSLLYPKTVAIAQCEAEGKSYCRGDLLLSE